MGPSIESRIAMFRGIVLILVLGIAGRLVWLQVIDRDRLCARADSQHRGEIEIASTRGEILDRHGRELAVSLRTESLFAHPWRVENPDQVAGALSPVLGIDRESLSRKLRSDRSFVYLHRFLDPRDAEAVRELDLSIGHGAPLGFLPSSRRHYPRGRLAVHVVGFANIDGEGVEGVENRLDEVLSGDPSTYMLLKNGQKGGLRQMLHAPDRPANGVILTLDVVLQYFVERELDRAMRETNALAASAVLLDARTGEVLALANRPTTGDFTTATADQRINRSVVHFYEPGSTFKLVSMAAALEHGAVRPDQRFDCERGALRLPGRTIRDTSPHGILSARRIFAKSSNIGMVKILDHLDPELFHETILDFGFTSRTGIELPGESPGMMRQLKDWNTHTRASLAFGHEIAVTVIQMASAFQTIANDGVRIPPRIVRGTRDAEGSQTAAKRPTAQRVVSSRTARELTSMLEAVIVDGTGTRAAVDGYRLGGKSGTAQKPTPGGFSDTDFVASFGGFGPVAAPRLVALVVIDTPEGKRHQGGRVAAPVFQRIMEAALTHLRVPPDHDVLPPWTGADTASIPDYASPDRRSDQFPEGHVPDLRGLSAREAVSILAGAGYLSHVQGSGVVVDQQPAAGTRLEKGQVCKLRLGTSAETALISQARKNDPARGAAR